MIQRNIQSNYILLDRYEAELADMGDMLQRAKTLILAQANANADQATREVTAQELQAIIDELYNAGNSKIGKLFIFSGTETLTQPLVNNGKVQPATAGMGEGDSFGPYDLDRFLAEFEGHSRNEYIVRVTKEGEFGRAHVKISDDGGGTWSKEQTLLRDIAVRNEDGKADDRVRLRFKEPMPEENGEPEQPYIFPAGIEFRFDPNPPVDYQGNLEKRMVPTGEGTYLPINFTAEEVFYKRDADPDSLNVFDLLYTIKRALLDDEPRVLEERIDEIDQAFNQVLNRRADVGATRRELERQFQKMGDRQFTKTKEMSELEDLDLQEAVTELNLAELRNQASLNTGARLIQPTLLEFLR
jgi:flagellar hook-associated protein 3 FlgL